MGFYGIANEFTDQSIATFIFYNFDLHLQYSNLKCNAGVTLQWTS